MRHNELAVLQVPLRADATIPGEVDFGEDVSAHFAAQAHSTDVLTTSEPAAVPLAIGTQFEAVKQR